MWNSTRAAIITHLSLGDSIARMATDMAGALTALGVTTTFVNMRPENVDAALVDQVVHLLHTFDGPKFILDFNAGMNPQVEVNGQRLNLLRELRIPRLTQFIDHPIRHERRLRQQFHKTALGMVARHHEPIGRALAPGAHTFFMPHGGPPAPHHQPPSAATRPIDFLFCGNIEPASDVHDLCAEMGLTDPMLCRAVEDMLAAHLEGGAHLWETMLEALRPLGLADDREGLSRLYPRIERWALATRRRASIAALPADRTLLICGNVPSDLKAPEQTDRVGTVGFDDFVDIAGNARILLNNSGTFRDGGHERVFYAMSRGAAVLTDGDQYLAADAVDLPIGAFWSIDHDLPLAIEALDARNAERTRDRMAEELRIYAQRHSWTQRLDVALRAMVDNGILEMSGR